MTKPTVPVSCVYVATEGDRLNVYIEVGGKMHRTHSVTRALEHNEVGHCANVGGWDSPRAAAGLALEPEPEQCDWFGYTGDSPQCVRESTTSVNGRSLCAEHAYNVVPR